MALPDDEQNSWMLCEVGKMSLYQEKPGKAALCHKRTFASGRETIKFEVSLFARYGNYVGYK